jgi:hypothetical protein
VAFLAILVKLNRSLQALILRDLLDL